MSLFFLFFLLIYHNAHALTTSELAKEMLPQGANNYIKNRVPFLVQDWNGKLNTIEKENSYYISMQNTTENYQFFSSLTSLPLEQTDFIASWYIFNNSYEIPSSISDILNLVNQQKPEYYAPLTFIKNSWRGQAELPYQTLHKGSQVLVYISMINRSGILVPVSSQSFYYDPIEDRMNREQSTGLNLDLVRFWYDKGYFAFTET